MDTRSRNIKYSAGLKCAAFFLAAICVFAAAWNAVGALKTLYDYGLEGTLILEHPEFTDTTYFRREVRTALNYVNTACLHNSWQEDGLSRYPTLEETQQDALEAFAVFREEVHEVAKYKYQTYLHEVYGYDWDDSLMEGTTAVTNAYGDAVQATEENVTVPQTVAEYEKYVTKTYGLIAFNAYIDFTTDMTEEDVKAQVERVYRTELAAQKRSFTENVTRATTALKDLVNFKYLLVQPETGVYYTNVEGAQTPEGFFAQLQKGEGDWYFAYTADAGLTDSSDIDNFYMMPFYDWVQSFCAEGYDVYVCVPMPLEPAANDSFYTESVRFAQESGGIEQRVILAAGLTVCALLLSLYLLLVAGRVRETAEARLSPLDRIPTDVHFLLSGALLFGVFFAAAVAIDAIFWNNTSAQYTLHGVPLLRSGIATLGVVGYAVLLEWIESVVKYNKAQKPYFKSMLLSRVLGGLFRGMRKGLRATRKALKRMHMSMQKLWHTAFFRFRHMTKKAWVFVIVYIGVNAVLCLSLGVTMYSGIWTLFLMLCIATENLVALIVLWKHLVALDKIIDAAKKSKTGEKVQDIGAEQMPEPLQSLARDLTFTQEEMQKAVGEAVKGERMKTELITNVSHDLKTPLTSIISYVDLLKKCDIDDVDAQKYITVLDEKSIRLKRLIEDLVEASKASSGAITLNKMRVDLYQLAVQAIGEMEDGFTANNLQIVLDEATGSTPVIDADSQKTWRIIDNLLGNARKYSLPGSRVYVRVFEQGDFGVFEIKNVSSKALNIDPDELTQRFVRGDSARTEEGSGLGLSIAKDLCTLQGGLLKIQIDGDLFKVTVALPLAPAMPQNVDAVQPTNAREMKGQG